jgi:hypothetical protein
LPDGIFSYQKSQFGKILEGLGIENVGIFYCSVEFYLRPFGILFGTFFTVLVNVLKILATLLCRWKKWLRLYPHR